MKLLDAELHVRDGKEYGFYAQFNKTDKIRHTLVAYQEGMPVGIGALRQYEPGSAEIKRMFVHPAYRRQGIAAALLAALEAWAAELGLAVCILETGRKQPEAIALYAKCGYERIPNFGPYVGVENSVCMRKQVR